MSDITVKIEQLSVRIDGDFNPAILNHDFLLRIKAIPEDTEPPEPTIIPVMASLDYGKRGLGVVVDLKHFQVSQEGDAGPGDAIRLATRYMETLEHTPVERVSFNFFGDVLFGRAGRVADFEAWLLRDKAALIANLSTTKLLVTIQLSYSFDEFGAIARLGPIDPEHKSMHFLSCYEKDISKAQDIVSLLESEAIISKIMKAPGLQLRDFCIGREAGG